MHSHLFNVIILISRYRSGHCSWLKPSKGSEQDTCGPNLPITFQAAKKADCHHHRAGHVARNSGHG